MQKQNSRRMLIAGNWYGAHHPFVHMFDRVEYVEDYSAKLTENDVILFGGGADIWAHLYGQQPNRYNGTHAQTMRDINEEKLFKLGVEAGAKFLGICRGAQLLCALSGGSLIQHVTGHAGEDHNMVTKDGELISVSSAHHQMLYPFNVDHEMIAYSEERRSRCYLIEKEKDLGEIPVEPEVVYFPKTKALAIQYHPEFMDSTSRGVSYAQELVTQYLLEA